MVETSEIKEMARYNTISDAVSNIKEMLKVAYPNATFFIVAGDRHLDPKDGQLKNYETAVKVGESRELECMTTRMCVINEWLNYACVNTTLNIISSYKPSEITSRQAAQLHDAAMDYGRFLGIDIASAGLEYCRESPKWREQLTGKPSDEPNVHRIGQKVKPMELEQHITQVEQELKRLKGMRNPQSMQSMMRDEIKRLKRKNELSAAKSLEAELEAFLEHARRQQEIRDTRLKNLEKANAALQEWRKRKLNAARQQPNFAKMAKQKRQQIAARKAEKKKKKAAGSSDSMIRSCSPLLAK